MVIIWIKQLSVLMEKQFAAINYIDKCLSKGTTKQKGTGNELLIAGNMYKYGFNV